MAGSPSQHNTIRHNDRSWHMAHGALQSSMLQQVYTLSVAGDVAHEHTSEGLAGLLRPLSAVFLQVSTSHLLCICSSRAAFSLPCCSQMSCVLPFNKENCSPSTLSIPKQLCNMLAHLLDLIRTEIGLTTSVDTSAIGHKELVFGCCGKVKSTCAT